jgi:PAS domain S-box-containing protein
MATVRNRRARKRSLSDRLLPIGTGIAWAAVGLYIVAAQGIAGGILPLALVASALGVTLLVQRLVQERRWSRPLHRLATHLANVAADPSQPLELSSTPELDELTRALFELQRAWVEASRLGASAAYYREVIAGGAVAAQPRKPTTSMTRSGLLAVLPAAAARAHGTDPNLSGDYSMTEMVNRLEPKTLRWIESSVAEQMFLGWDQAALREKSFFDIVHADDRPRVKEQIGLALEKGEAHGLVVRIKTAQGAPKAIEVDIGARYGPDMAVTHLRCHLTDVSDKIRAERELRLRTRELTQVNEQLRQINRELEELKDRYRDLYQNAPAMYYTLDADGCLVDCNETLLRTLGRARADVVGQSFDKVLAERSRASFAATHAELQRRGSMEMEGQWTKANGELIDVWVSATAVPGRDGKLLQTRSVAQDVTARHQLEAALKEKNEHLARTNEELSRKNREMDEFAYVVSHDLQEPLRTLIAFSDFLLKDCSDRLDPTGQEYVRYLVQASRRMRGLIQGLLNLSRAGKVTGEFEPVNLEELVDVLKADLGELVRSRGAEIRVSGPMPMVWGDRGRLGQLLANLITNGLKYNRSTSPWVELGTLTSEPGSWVTFYIRDNGIGIDPQFHGRIFQLFRRLHTQEEYEGTGAGLAICKKIVEAHGGRIWVESTPNEGATFFFSLKRSQHDAPSPAKQVPHAS